MKALMTILIILGVASFHQCYAETFHVPSEYTGIQEAMDAAQDGDTILVAPGTYHSSVNFLGKAVHLLSSGGPAVTKIIRNGSIVSFYNGEEPDSILNGFTLTDHNMSDPIGAVVCDDASPTIINNVFIDCLSGENGAGIGTYGGSPSIINNAFINNDAFMTEACMGGSGIFVEVGAPFVFGNYFSENYNSYGSGIMCCADNSVIRNNIFFDNEYQSIHGDYSYAEISFNTFVNFGVGWCPGAAFEFTGNIFHNCSTEDGPVEGNFYGDPLFVTGPWGDFYLSQVAAGQSEDSPCLNAGSEMLPYAGTTRTDHVKDREMSDYGYHYIYRGLSTVLTSDDSVNDFKMPSESDSVSKRVYQYPVLRNILPSEIFNSYPELANIALIPIEISAFAERGF